MAANLVSASAIVGVEETGHYVYHVDPYSRTKDLPNGRWIESPTFTVGDCSWRIRYHPNGVNSCFAGGYVSLFLVLIEGSVVVDEPVVAISKFSLLDGAGNPLRGWSNHRTDLSEFFFVGDVNGFVRFIRRGILERSLGGHVIVNDCLKIRCDVSVITTRTEDRAAPLSDLPRHLVDLLEAEHGADTTFLVGGETFRAHRCILAARSPVFEAELFTRRPGIAAGAGHYCVRIDNMEAATFKALLRFVYTDSLPPEITTMWPEDARSTSRSMAKALLTAADEYGMEKLKMMCARRLRRDVNLNTAAELLALAVRHRCPVLKEACTKFLRCPPVLEMVVATSDGFDNVARSCPALLKDLWDDWFEDDPVQDELRNLPG